MAPSLFNTQPWRFRLCPDRIEVHADLGRRLIGSRPRGPGTADRLRCSTVQPPVGAARPRCHPGGDHRTRRPGSPATTPSCTRSRTGEPARADRVLPVPTHRGHRTAPATDHTPGEPAAPAGDPASGLQPTGHRGDQHADVAVDGPGHHHLRPSGPELPFDSDEMNLNVSHCATSSLQWVRVPLAWRNSEMVVKVTIQAVAASSFVVTVTSPAAAGPSCCPRAGRAADAARFPDRSGETPGHPGRAATPPETWPGSRSG